MMTCICPKELGRSWPGLISRATNNSGISGSDHTLNLRACVRVGAGPAIAASSGADMGALFTTRHTVTHVVLVAEPVAAVRGSAVGAGSQARDAIVGCGIKEEACTTPHDPNKFPLFGAFGCEAFTSPANSPVAAMRGVKAAPLTDRNAETSPVVTTKTLAAICIL